jgi:hypothetical protein
MGIFNLNSIIVEALAKKNTFRQPFSWFKYEDILSGNCELWNTYRRVVPTAEVALRDVIQMREKRSEEIKSKFNIDDEELNHYLHTFLGLDPVRGLYYGSLGPYNVNSGEEKLFFTNFMRPNGINESSTEDVLRGIQLAKQKMAEWMAQNNKGEPTPTNISRVLDDIAKGIRTDIKAKRNTTLDDSIKQLIIGRSGDRVKFYYKVAIRIENDMTNKFGFFSKRYQPINRNTII